MNVYVLIEHLEFYPHDSRDKVVSASTNSKLIFYRAKRLARDKFENESSWERYTYSVHVFNGLGKRVEIFYFDSNRRREGTFGKIVCRRGDQEPVVSGEWYK